MAKATITFTDDGDNVSCSVDFDPPLTAESDSPAQYEAAKAMEILAQSKRDDGTLDEESMDWSDGGDE
jgi:hypothetical protein